MVGIEHALAQKWLWCPGFIELSSTQQYPSPHVAAMLQPWYGAPLLSTQTSQMNGVEPLISMAGAHAPLAHSA